jgi:citrate synthase
MPDVVTKGMEGVVVADSSICFIDGQRGVLRYRGLDIADLAQYASYEETVYLLWFGRLPTAEELDAFKAMLAAQRGLDDSVWDMLISFPCWPEPMEALRSAVSALSSCDPNAGEDSFEANRNKALYVTAKLPTIVAYHYRHSMGKDRIDPDPSLSHAANFLYMLRGTPPTELEEQALDLALVLMADHGFNASTFSARVTASTLSDMYSAITSAIGTLKGPLHGGANERAMEMLLEIGDEARVDAYIGAALEAKKRIMGFGHRVYKTMDPRAIQLRTMVCTLEAEAKNPKWCHLALAVEEAMSERLPNLYPNVDFYSAPTLYTLGIPTNLFTPIFAISRVAGWTAHVLEQYQDNRLIRPRANYVGSGPQAYVPLADRPAQP